MFFVANRKKAHLGCSAGSKHATRSALLPSPLTSLRLPIAISATLEAQNTSFVALANKIATLDTDFQRLKALYTQLWRAKTGSMRDPFSQLDRGSGGEFGVESLYGK